MDDVSTDDLVFRIEGEEMLPVLIPNQIIRNRLRITDRVIGQFLVKDLFDAVHTDGTIGFLQGHGLSNDFWFLHDEATFEAKEKDADKGVLQ